MCGCQSSASDSGCLININYDLTLSISFVLRSQHIVIWVQIIILWQLTVPSDYPTPQIPLTYFEELHSQAAGFN